MNYRRYKKSRDLTWQILLNENVAELPVDIVGLCHKIGIRVHYYTPLDNNDGYSSIILGTAHIFVSRNCLPERQRFTIAHELGHILLGHVGEHQLVNREPSADDNPIEQEANVFASRILAPACVLWALDLRTKDEIAKECRISIQAAGYRAERMALLYERKKFLISPLEREVYEQFKPFILRENRKRIIDHQEHQASDRE